MNQIRDDVFVQVMDLPSYSVREMVTRNDDMSYTIFINARIGYKAQMDALAHALKHIDDQDFDRSDVQEIEAVAHGRAAERQPMAEFLAKLQRRRRSIARRMAKLEEERRMLEEFVPEYRSQRYL